MKKKILKDFMISLIFFAVAMVLPFWTGQIPEIASMVCPMHIPILLWGYYCGGFWGAVTGAVAALVRGAAFGMPQLFPNAVCMAFELAAYGLVMGILREKWKDVKLGVFAMLAAAMVIGRVVWGIAMFACMGFNPAKFGFGDFITGAVTNTTPGIAVQFALIPIFVMTINNMRKDKE